MRRCFAVCNASNGLGSSRVGRVVQVREQDAGMRLDRWLRYVSPSTHMGAIEKAIRTRRVKLASNAEHDCRPQDRVVAGQEFWVPFSNSALEETSPPAESSQRQHKVPFPVLYEDDNCIVINKPDGVTVHGPDSLAHLMPDFRSVHRLDAAVTGCLLLAKTRASAQALVEQWTEVKKKYTALCAVEDESQVPDSGTITTAIAWVRLNRGEDVLMLSTYVKPTHDVVQVWDARTDFRVVMRAPGLVLFDLEPHTGKKHQLRLHCSYGLQAPVVGDLKYMHGEMRKSLSMFDRRWYRKSLAQAPPSSRKPFSGLKGDSNRPRLLLHCRELLFNNTRVEAPLPDYFQQTLDDLNKYKD